MKYFTPQDLSFLMRCGPNDTRFVLSKDIPAYKPVADPYAVPTAPLIRSHTAQEIIKMLAEELACAQTSVTKT